MQTSSLDWMSQTRTCSVTIRVEVRLRLRVTVTVTVDLAIDTTGDEEPLVV